MREAERTQLGHAQLRTQQPHNVPTLYVVYIVFSAGFSRQIAAHSLTKTNSAQSHGYLSPDNQKFLFSLIKVLQMVNRPLFSYNFNELLLKLRFFHYLSVYG